METTPKVRRERRRRRRLLAFLTVAMMGGSVMTASLSLAAFTSSATLVNPFSAGTVKITANAHNDEDGTGNGTITFNPTGKMKPKDVVRGSVDVVNAGDFAFTYNIVVTSAATGVVNTNDLADALRLDITEVASTATCSATAAPGSGTAFTGSFTTAKAAPLTSLAALASGAASKLCVIVSWPEAATDNTFKNAGTSVTFKFNATQQ